MSLLLYQDLVKSVFIPKGEMLLHFSELYKLTQINTTTKNDIYNIQKRQRAM